MRIPLAIAGCAVFWLMAIGLLAWDTWSPSVDAAGRWGLLSAAVAASWTVLVALRSARMQFADVIEWRVRKALQEEQIASLEVARRV